MQTYNLDLTLTAAELHQLAADRNHYAHSYLWSDGASTWDINTLSESIGDEAVEDGGPDSQISLSPCDLSDAGRKLFTENFINEATGIDCMEKIRWSMPWEWDKYRDYFNKHLMPDDMGRAWVKIMMTEEQK